MGWRIRVDCGVEDVPVEQAAHPGVVQPAGAAVGAAPQPGRRGHVEGVRVAGMRDQPLGVPDAGRAGRGPVLAAVSRPVQQAAAVDVVDHRRVGGAYRETLNLQAGLAVGDGLPGAVRVIQDRVKPPHAAVGGCGIQSAGLSRVDREIHDAAAQIRPAPATTRARTGRRSGGSASRAGAAARHADSPSIFGQRLPGGYAEGGVTAGCGDAAVYVGAGHVES